MKGRNYGEPRCMILSVLVFGKLYHKMVLMSLDCLLIISTAFVCRTPTSWVIIIVCGHVVVKFWILFCRFVNFIKLEFIMTLSHLPYSSSQCWYYLTLKSFKFSWSPNTISYAPHIYFNLRKSTTISVVHTDRKHIFRKSTSIL